MSVWQYDFHSDHLVGLGHSEAEATVDEVNDLKAADCGFIHRGTRPDPAHLSRIVL